MHVYLVGNLLISFIILNNGLPSSNPLFISISRKIIHVDKALVVKLEIVWGEMALRSR